MRFPLSSIRIALAASHGAVGVWRRTPFGNNRNNNAGLSGAGD